MLPKNILDYSAYSFSVKDYKETYLISSNMKELIKQESKFKKCTYE